MNHLRLNGSEFLDAIREIISENLDNDQFDVAELATLSGISRSSLHRRLKAASGVPAGVFIRSIKLEKAKELLEGSSGNITEIAYECGFSSLTYFDICFKEHFGYPPGKYRKDLSIHNDSATGSAKTAGDLADNPVNELYHFPVPVTSFIGRKKEILAVSELLTNHRVLSLVGAGGSGKTRLACEVAAQLPQKFEDGIWFVDLSSIQKGEFVAREVMKTLNITEAGDEDPLETLARKAKELNCLILLDNCEHLAEDVARVADRLCRSVPGIKILVTSRVVLNTGGEKVWRIPTLSLVDPEKVKKVEQAKQSEAVQLFRDRARLTDPRFELAIENCRDIALICKQLDGIPLAIELVASRTKFMDPSMMLNRLSGKFSALESLDPGAIGRHKTVNTAIDWSYTLLLKEEKLLFRRLSVFSGGFYLEAAEAICNDKLLQEEYILDLLSNLVDRSMVNTDRIPGQPIRYYLLETIRQYAWELLPEKKQHCLQRKHLDYFISYSEEAWQERLTAQGLWIKRLNLEFENMMAALAWSEIHNRTKQALLAGLLAWYWVRSGNNALARKVLGMIIQDRKIKSESRARILLGYSWASMENFDLWPTIMKYSKQSVAIWKRLGNIKEESVSTAELSLLNSSTGDNEAGLKLAQRSNELARIDNDAGVVLNSLWPLSQVLVNLKRCNEALPVIKKILDLAEQLENLHLKFVGHHNFGDCAAIQGKFRLAEEQYGKGLETTVQSGDLFFLLTELMGIAIAVSGMGRYEKALRLTGASNEKAKKEGSFSREQVPMLFWQELIKEHITGAREKLGEELARKCEAEGAAMELEEAVAYALDFERD